MMGWAMLAGMALIAAVFLALTGFPRRLWMIAATGLMLGAAGYAWQGSPALKGHPVSAMAKKGEIDPGIVALREAMFGKFGTYTYSYATAADRMTRDGRPDLAAAIWLGAVRKVPDDAGLWTGLATALAESDGNQISPAANFAFQKARALYPQHPGPVFFEGLALIRAGRFAEAQPLWAKAAELTPSTVSYRGELLVRSMLLDRFLEEQGAQAGVPPAQPAPQP